MILVVADQPHQSVSQREAVRFGPIAPTDQRRSLAMLLTGRANEGDPAVEQFISFADAQRLSLEQLWSAWDINSEQILASVLIVPAAGRTAMLFISPTIALDDWVLPQLIQQACDAQNRAQMTMIQCLLDPRQTSQRSSLLQAGFDDLAILVYMTCPTDKPCEPLDLEDTEISIINWSEPARPIFAQTILASYRDTLDCPGLLGLRDIDDVIDGHMASGKFAAKNWFALYCGEEPVGVMLLSEVGHGNAFELVYLGLAPPYRGKTLATRLLRHGLGLAAAGGATQMLLAVDEKNTPALRLYETLGFNTTGRKVALIYPLSAQAISLCKTRAKLKTAQAVQTSQPVIHNLSRSPNQREKKTSRF